MGIITENHERERERESEREKRIEREREGERERERGRERDREARRVNYGTHECKKGRDSLREKSSGIISGNYPLIISGNYH